MFYLLTYLLTSRAFLFLVPWACLHGEQSIECGLTLNAPQNMFGGKYITMVSLRSKG